MTQGGGADRQVGPTGCYSKTAIQTCVTMKLLFGMALWQTTSFVESLLRFIDPDLAVPNFSTLAVAR